MRPTKRILSNKREREIHKRLRNKVKALSPSLPLWHTLTFYLFLSLSLTHTHTHSLYLSLSFSLFPCKPLTHTTHSFSISPFLYTHSLSSLTHSLFISFSFPPYLSLTPHTHISSLFPSTSLTHTPSLFTSPFLSLSLSLTHTQFSSFSLTSSFSFALLKTPIFHLSFSILYKTLAFHLSLFSLLFLFFLSLCINIFISLTRVHLLFLHFNLFNNSALSHILLGSSSTSFLPFFYLFYLTHFPFCILLFWTIIT